MRTIVHKLVFMCCLSGCLLGPDYSRPELVLPGEWSKASEAWVPVEELSQKLEGNWWSVFNEPLLPELVSQVVSNNFTLRSARHQVEVVLSQAGVEQGQLFPQLSLEGSAERRGTSGAARQSAGTFPRRTFSSFITSSVISWELDLWGRIRREVEALTAEGSALLFEAEGLQLSLQTQVASRYYQARSLHAQTKVLHRTVDLRKDTLELAEARFAAGETDALDVERAKAELAVTKVTLDDRERQLAQTLVMLSQLLGSPSLALELPDEMLSWKPLSIPQALPSELVRQRPDVLAEEQRVVSANARIGVAKTAFFPRISLAGAFGYQAAEEGDLFTTPSRFWSLGPNLTLPLFRGGANVNQLSATEATYKAAVEQYKAVVLNAFLEVKSALIQLAALEQQLEDQLAAVKAASAARELSETRYKSGLVSYLEVLDAQRTELQTELAHVDLIGQYYVSVVDLIRALGGSWIVAPERTTGSVKN